MSLKPLLEKDLEYVRSIDAEEWIPLIMFTKHEGDYKRYDHVLLISFSVNNNNVNELVHPRWDINGIYDCFKSSTSDDSGAPVYKKYNDFFHPIVIQRCEPKLNKIITSISEEYVMFYNLFESNEYYYYYDDYGEIKKLIKIDKEGGTIYFEKSHLFYFLSVKKHTLVIQFWFMEYSQDRVEENLLENYNIDDMDMPYHYSICNVPEFDCLNTIRYHSIGQICGKKIITPEYDCSMINKNFQFAEFIIGKRNGIEVISTCDVNTLNRSDDNIDTPHYLTPVFFKKSVLKKYYGNPQYLVGDGYVSYMPFWTLNIDNNHAEVVMVYLGDIGNILPYNEQLYWRSFNVAPSKGYYTYVAYKRDLCAEETEPIAPDLIFKGKYDNFKRIWKEQYGWDLFCDMHIDEQYHYTALHIPEKDNNKEFEEQIISLHKLMVESINVEELNKKVAKEIDQKSIALLEKYISLKCGQSESEKIISILYRLNKIRSCSSGHRKGKKYDKFVRPHIEECGTDGFFIDILNGCTILIDTIYKLFIKHEKIK